MSLHTIREFMYKRNYLWIYFHGKIQGKCIFSSFLFDGSVSGSAFGVCWVGYVRIRDINGEALRFIVCLRVYVRCVWCVGGFAAAKGTRMNGTRWRNQVAKLCEEGLVNHSSLSTYVTKGYMCHSLTIWLRFRIYNIILRIMHGSSPILVCVIHMRMRCDRTKNIRRLFKFIHTSTEMHISSEYYSCSWRFLWYKLWANLLCCLCGMNAIDERGIV